MTEYILYENKKTIPSTIPSLISENGISISEFTSAVQALGAGMSTDEACNAIDAFRSEFTISRDDTMSVNSERRIITSRIGPGLTGDELRSIVMAGRMSLKLHQASSICEACSYHSGNQHLTCAVHPDGPENDECPDFEAKS